MTYPRIVAITLLSAALCAPVFAEESVDEKIARAVSAAPAYISDQAAVMDDDGTILREGSNGWTCLPNTFPGDKAPLCNDAVWMEMFGAFKAGADFTPDRVGLSYMLQGDIGAGVSNSNPFHADHANAEDYTEMGPHVMIIVPKELLEGIPHDPSGKGPHIMWGDTPYAHIMMPVGTED